MTPTNTDAPPAELLTAAKQGDTDAMRGLAEWYEQRGTPADVDVGRGLRLVANQCDVARVWLNQIDMVLNWTPAVERVDTDPGVANALEADAADAIRTFLHAAGVTTIGVFKDVHDPTLFGVIIPHDGTNRLPTATRLLKYIKSAFPKLGFRIGSSGFRQTRVATHIHHLAKTATDVLEWNRHWTWCQTRLPRPLVNRRFYARFRNPDRGD